MAAPQDSSTNSDTGGICPIRQLQELRMITLSKMSSFFIIWIVLVDFYRSSERRTLQITQGPLHHKPLRPPLVC